MVFHWSLSDSKSPQVSRTLLSILAVLNNVIVWMVSTRPPTSKSSSPFSNPLVTLPKAPITIGIIVTCMFHSFSLARSRYLSFFSHSFRFIMWSPETAKSTILQFLFFFLLVIITSVYYYCYYYNYYHHYCELFTIIFTGGFRLKFELQQVSCSLQRILADFNSTMVWLILILPLISNSSISQNSSICQSFRFLFFRIFRTSVKWRSFIQIFTIIIIIILLACSFNRVWVTASFLRSPGFFAVL